MPIDANIILGLKPPQLDSPLNALAQIAQLQAHQQQAKLGALELQQKQQGMDQDAATRDAVKRFGADESANANLLLQAGDLKAHDAYKKTIADAAEKRTLAQKQSADATKSALEAKRSVLTMVQTPEQMGQWVDALYADPLTKSVADSFGPADQVKARIPTDPAAFKQFLQQNAMGMDKFIQNQTSVQNNASTNATHLQTAQIQATTSAANNANTQANENARSANTRNAQLLINGLDSQGNFLPLGSTAPVASPAISALPAPLRNNNPGAMMPGGKLATYSTPEEGLAALDSNLQSYGKKGIDTLSGVISRWSPPNENDTQGYIKTVAQRLGVDPNQKIDLSNPYVRHAISGAIMLQENGPNGVFGKGQPASAPAAAAPAAVPASGTDKGGGVYQGTIDAIGQYRQPASLLLARAPAAIRSRIEAELQKQYPDYDANEYNNRKSSELNFTSGKASQTVRSFNVALAHLDTLDKLADALNNKDTQAVNRIGNFVSQQMGAPNVTNFEAAKKIVTDEITKAIVGAGGTGGDREHAASTIAAANSPAQLKGAIATYKDLMVGQLQGLEDQYKATIRKDDFRTRYLSSEAQGVMANKGKQSSTPADIDAILKKHGVK